MPEHAGMESRCASMKGKDMPLFTQPIRTNSKSQDKNIATKSKKRAVAQTVVRGGSDILTKINQMKAVVETNLGQYKDEYQVITQKEVLHDFITECIGNSYISIDTETDGLDPLQNVLAGICPYTYGQKGSYIPLNHLSYITHAKADGQLPIEFVISEFNRLLEKKPDIDMFNANFDIRFLRANGLKDIYCTWDGYLASRILNENEEHKDLKHLHNKYCLDGKGDAFRFDDLFKGIPFTLVPYSIGYLYAAHDPVITTEYCDYQRQFLRADNEREDMRQLYHVFKDIEMPCVDVITAMEDNGIKLDLNYSQELSVRYNQMLEEKKQAFYDACEPYSKQIDIARANGAKLDDPINIGSSQQLAVLIYDILKEKSVDMKSPRGTGVDILTKINNPICKAVLEYREVQKLLSTYIDKLPECVNPKDGRIHCHFNQYGADTGRMSSSDPNLQNIPSHNKEIRKMFVASDGYVLMSSDFSQQEPKALAAMCKKRGDSQMYDAFMQGKDIYSEIASKSFHRAYEECREFNPDGTTNAEGKERRKQAKSILLGVLYGRGEASIAEQLGCTIEEARAIKNDVFAGFPAIKQFEEDSLDMGETLGYVTTVCGRKRRLPDLQLDEFEFRWKDGPKDVDLLDFDSDASDEVPEKRQKYYLRKLRKAWGSEKRVIFEEANKEGIWIIDNGAKIADARRQCVNARIQGSAADLTKLAMIDLQNHDELKCLGFRLLIPVHDEVIAECPEENMEECARLLAETMSNAAEKILEMPIKCDVEITKAWYGEPIVGQKKEKEASTARQFENEIVGFSNNWVSKAQEDRKREKRKK